MASGIVIFGCGYLGSELARQAIAKGLRVTALTRNKETAAVLRSLGAELVVEAQLEEDGWHSQINPTQDFVVNCVGASGGGIEGYVKSYLNGQESIARWAADGAVGTYLFTGSVSVYPQTDGRLVDEQASCDGASDRGALLLAAEAIGFPGSTAVNRSFVLRLAGIYGPGRHVFLSRIRAGERNLSGDGEAWLNLIHRDDACSAIWAALESPPEIVGRIFNVSDGQPVLRQELVNWLAGEISVEPPSFSGIANPGRTAPGTQLPNRKIDNVRIREELGWEPRYPSFREGYADLLGDA